LSRKPLPCAVPPGLNRRPQTSNGSGLGVAEFWFQLTRSSPPGAMATAGAIWFPVV